MRRLQKSAVTKYIVIVIDIMITINDESLNQANSNSILVFNLQALWCVFFFTVAERVKLQEKYSVKGKKKALKRTKSGDQIDGKFCVKRIVHFWSHK